MAGKKNRKRRTGLKKKVTKENINEGIVVCEEKKPKLDDDLEGQAEQSEKHSQEPNFETAIADTNSDVSEVKDLQTEENKYVPPFTRKAKRTLHRDRCPVSPDVKTTRPKRPWNGSKQTSKVAQQSPAAQQTNDVTSTKDSPKVREEENEKEVDVGLQEVMTCSQERNDLGVISASQTATDEHAVRTDGTLSSSPVVTVQEEISPVVMHVIDDVLDTVSKCINQCNSEEITSEFNKQEFSKCVEGIDPQVDANIDNEATYSSNQDDVTEAASEPSMETVIKTFTVPTKAELKKITTGKSVTKCSKAGPGSQTATAAAMKQQQQQQQNQATERQSVEGHVSSAQEEGTSGECDRQVRDPAGETLQNYTNFELPYGLHQNENDNRLKQQRETDNELCNQSFIVISKGECVRDEEAEPKDLGIECSAIITTPEVKDVALISNVITSINEEVQCLAMNKELSLPKVCSMSYDSEEEYQQQKAGLLPEHTGMESNMDTPVLQKEVPSTVNCDIYGDNENDICQHESDQGLDQMVPTNCEATTVVLLGNSDIGEFTRKLNRKESALEDNANACSKPQYSPKVGKREHKNDELDKKMDHSVVVVDVNGSCKGSSQPLAQGLDICVDQEPIIYGEKTTDQTVTCTKSTLQHESVCKQVIPGTTELHKTVEGKTTENQSSNLEAGCSTFGFDGDIMEFDCLMDCTDSQLVHVDEFSDEAPLPESQTHDASQLNNSGVAGNSTNDGNQCGMEVPSDRGMIKGLISELSGLNKFIMGAWKDLENQKKRRQARLKLGKMKKFK